MVAVPENVATVSDMIRWAELTEQLKKLKVEEMFLRKKIFGTYFKDPVEGTNSYPLENGYVLKGKRTIDRTVDEALFVALRSTMQGKVPLDDLVQFKPSLNLRCYRQLTEEELAVFDQCLTIKDGSPSLEIVLPAATKRAQAAAEGGA